MSDLFLPCYRCLVREATVIADEIGAVCEDCLSDALVTCRCGQRFVPVAEESLCLECGTVAQDLADGVPGQAMAMDLRVKHALIAMAEGA